MQTRRLGQTDLELTAIGFGTWQFGGRWGGADDSESEAAVHAALDAGINWIDTADIYGQGRAESIVGKVLRARDDDVIVSTKGGVAWEVSDQGLQIWREASREYLTRALEDSLSRLGLERVDIYHVHWPVTGVSAEETIGTLLDLKRAGKIGAIGVSNYDLADLEATDGVGQIDALQNGYHLMRRDIEDGAIAWCKEHGVGVLAYGPLAHGLLTGRMRAGTTFPDNDWRAASELFTDEHFSDRIEAVSELEGLAQASGRTGGVAELAVAWVLRRPEVASAIVGGRSPAQVASLAGWATTPLSADEESRIEEILAGHPGTDIHYSHGEPPNRNADDS
jgi:aryl-alcohol dehydrogenase-like predicted oxidoreductase